MATIQYFLDNPDALRHSRVSITDYEGTKHDLKILLSRIESMTNLFIHMPKLDQLPPGLERFNELKTLHLRVPNTFDIPSKNLPSGIEKINIECKELRCLPKVLFSNNLKSLSIQTENLKDQNIVIKGPQIIADDLFLRIGNLRHLPQGINYQRLRNLELNSDTLKNLPPDLLSNSDIATCQIICPRLGSLPQIVDCPNLRYLIVKTQNPLDLSTAELQSAMETLTILSPYTILPDLSKAIKLNYLFVTGLVGILDSAIGYCTVLKRLHIQNSQLSDVSPETSNLQSLTEVYISNTTLDHIPPCFLELQNLKTLNLSNNKIETIEFDWSKLKSLENLNLSNNNINFESFEFTSDLPKLKILNARGNLFKDRYIFIHKKRIPLETMGMHGLHPSISERDILAFGSAIAKIKFSDKVKNKLLDEYWEKGTLKGVITSDHRYLIAALNIQYATCRKEAEEILDDLITQHEGASSLNSNSVIYIEGKSKETATKIKQIIKDLGYTYSPKLSEKVTHVIIGKNPKNIAALNTDEYRYINENTLHEMRAVLNPGFLVKAAVEDSATTKKVRLLLENSQAANVMIGLKMLETGGVPEEVHNPLLVLAKANEDATVRANAKKLLQIHGPKRWTNLLEDKQLFKKINTKVKEQDLNNKFKKIGKSVGIEEVSDLAIELFRRHGKGLRYLVLRKSLPERYKKAIYDLMVEDGHFNFSRGLGFKNWKNTPPENRILFDYKIKFPFPVDVLKYHKITSIDLHNTKLTSIPKELYKFSDLKSIDLSCNLLTAINPQIKALHLIEELDLSFNKFDDFPINIIKLPNLRKVDLRYNREKYDIKVLTIPGEVKAALPNCEILV